MQGKSQAGGILSIVAGAFGLLGSGWTLVMIFLVRFVFSQPELPDIPGFPLQMPDFIAVVYAITGIFLLLLSVLAIIGGIFAMRRRYWELALAGAIAASIIFFPAGIAATILIALGQGEFTAMGSQISTGR